MQHYIYHWVPNNMEGTILYPLNQLKVTHPHLYDQHTEKYKGREHQLEYTIPLMQCLWNDMVHLSAIDPKLISQRLREAGFTYPPRKFYKIPVSMLDKDKLCVMYQTNDDPNTYIKGYEMFDENNFEAYMQFPAETSEYYKEMKSKAHKPLVHHLLTHVLYKGTIDVSGVEIIDA